MFFFCIELCYSITDIEYKHENLNLPCIQISCANLVNCPLNYSLPAVNKLCTASSQKNVCIFIIHPMFYSTSKYNTGCFYELRITVTCVWWWLMWRARLAVTVQPSPTMTSHVITPCHASHARLSHINI